MSQQKEIDTVLDDVLNANRIYANYFGDKHTLALPPSRELAILTCMDARLDPAKFLGIKEGEAHVIRNAGGRASDDAIRSLIISHKLLGTKTWLVIHHSNCGMQTFNDSVMRDLLRESLSTAQLSEEGWKNVTQDGGSIAADFVPFLSFTDLEKSVRDDLYRIRNHPLVNPKVTIYGFIYQVETGKLISVPF